MNKSRVIETNYTVHHSSHFSNYNFVTTWYDDITVKIPTCQETSTQKQRIMDQFKTFKSSGAYITATLALINETFALSIDEYILI